MGKKEILSFATNLVLNPTLIYLSSDFLIRKKDSQIIIIIYYILYLLFFIISSKVIFPIYKKIINWIFLILTGIFTMTLPMGIVFALTGSYVLAIKIFLTVYLPVALVGLANLNLIQRHKRA